MQCLQWWINHHHLNEWMNWSSPSCVSISSVQKWRKQL
jgi:hypothetical protein